MQQSGKNVKRTLGQKTEDRLMKYILDKPVKIGERIPTEGELTELFEVGRSTVREAVKGWSQEACWKCAEETELMSSVPFIWKMMFSSLEMWRTVIGWHWICLMYV